MKVYVLTTGLYEDVAVHGVYASAEAAMAAWHPSRPETVRPIQMLPAWPDEPRTYQWKNDGYGWEFDADWGDHARIEEFEVKGLPCTLKGSADETE